MEREAREKGEGAKAGATPPPTPTEVELIALGQAVQDIIFGEWDIKLLSIAPVEVEHPYREIAKRVIQAYQRLWHEKRRITWDVELLSIAPAPSPESEGGLSGVPNPHEALAPDPSHRLTNLSARTWTATKPSLDEARKEYQRDICANGYQPKAHSYIARLESEVERLKHGLEYFLWRKTL